MKISKLIEELQRIQAQHGDMEVLANDECGSEVEFDREALYVSTGDNSEKTLSIDA